MRLTAHRFHRWPLVAPLTLALLGILVLVVVFRDRILGGAHHGSTPVLATAAAELSLQPGACEIVSVRDAQTLLVRQRRGRDNSPAHFHVRLLGVQLARPSADIEGLAIAAAAQRELAQLARPGNATIELDKRRAGGDGVWLAYVSAEGKLLNAELIRTGWAEYDVYPGDSFAVGRLLSQAQREARQAGRGVWQREQD